MVNMVTFLCVKYLMVPLMCNFSGLQFYTLSKTLIACRVIQLIFFKVETLLNNVFNAVYLLKVYYILPAFSFLLFPIIILSSTFVFLSVL